MNDDNGQVIQEDSHEPSNFAMIPQMAIMELDPYELALYCNYKITARDSGACWKSNAKVALETGMSESKMRQTRLSLITKGYIQLTEQADESGNINTPPVITIVNIWSQNRSKYGVSENRGVAPENTPRATRKQGGSTRKHQSISNELEAGEEQTRKRESVFNIAKMSDKQLQAYYDGHAALLDELLLLTGIDVQFCHWREMDLTQRRAYVRAWEAYLSKGIDYHDYTAWLTKELIWRKPFHVTLKDFTEGIPRYRTSINTPQPAPKTNKRAALLAALAIPEPDDLPLLRREL